MKIRFADTAHKEFYLSMKEKVRTWDSYHQALFYILGLSSDCRNHIKDLFCFEGEEYGIRFETAFDHGWHTSGSLALTRMGFNLWNGYKDEGTSPDDLFDNEYERYLFEGIKLRYPNYVKDERYCVMDDAGNIVQENIPGLLIANSYVKLFEKENGGKYSVELQPEIVLEV